MPRRLLIPERVCRPTCLTGGAKTSGGASTDYQREVRRESKILQAGRLSPFPVGTPDADIDVDVLLRSSGDADGARWTWRNYGTGTYHGKSRAGDLSDVKLLRTASSSGTRLSRPKLLALASGELLCLHLVGTASDGAEGVSWLTWSTTNGWSVTTNLSLSISGGNYRIRAVDAVQFPDTGEIVVMVLTTIGGSTAILQRFSCAIDSDIAAPLSIVPTGTWMWQQTLTSVDGMAMEILPSGNRLSMLIHDNGAALWATVSNDRGVTWSNLKVAGQYAQNPVLSLGMSLASPGGVSMCQTRAGHLMAIAPAVSAAYEAAVGWTEHSSPRLRFLMSADGINWEDMVKASWVDNDVNAGNVISQAEGLLEEGMSDGAIVVGDDGLPRIFGCLHGDPAATLTGFFDELTLLTIGSPDLTPSDAGRLLRGAEAYSVNSTGRFVMTGPKGLDGQRSPTSNANVLSGSSKPAATLSRCSPQNIAGGGLGSGDLRSSPSFRGLRTLDVVNFRGALWMVCAFEDTAATTSALVFARSNVWDELLALPPETSLAASVFRGRVPQLGYLPGATPDRYGWTRTGTAGNVTMNTGTGGCKIDNGDGVATYFSTATLGGLAGYATELRFTVVPGSGGDLTANNIALRLRQTVGGARCSFSIRFTSTSIAVVDESGPTTLQSATGLDLSNGVEVRLLYDGASTLTAVFYRVLAATDPESDGAWTALVSAGAVGTIAGATESLEWGNMTTTPAVSTWRFHAHGRLQSTSLSTRALLQAHAMTSQTYAEMADDPASFLSRIPAYDDGLRHGSRAPVCTSRPEAWIKSGVKVRWAGAAGIATPPSNQDHWRVTSSWTHDQSRIRKGPVGDFWRSADCSAASFHKFDAGNDERFKPEQIALFRCNAAFGRVQLNDTDAWGGPSIDVDFGCASETIARYDLKLSSGWTVEGANNQVVRLTSGSLTKNRYRSNDRVTWYVYSSSLNRTRKITGNDGTRIYLDGSLSGATGYIAIFPDVIAFSLGSLTAAGYRYMRVQVGNAAATAETTAEGYFKLGLVVPGYSFALADPGADPEWGFSHRRTPRTVEAGGPFYKSVRNVGPALRSWAFGFDFLRAATDRSNLTSTPTVPTDLRGTYQELLDMLEASLWGEEICALFYEPDDHVADGAYSTFGRRTFDVAPVRVRAAFDAKHLAYEYLTTEQLNKPVYSVAPILLEEVA